MAQVNEYPKLQGANCPYLDSLKIKLMYAKEYAPHKVGYYEQLIKDWINHTPKNNN